LPVLAAAVLCATPGPILSGEKSSYELVLAGKECETGTWDQTLSCEYKVGAGLKFVIAGIGQPDTAVTLSSPPSREIFMHRLGFYTVV
jgi:hypothetical protein